MMSWLRKKASAFASAVVADEQRTQYNALMMADPQRLINAITAWRCGNLSLASRIVEELELRDDKMRTCSKKLRASVARCEWEVAPRRGFEGDSRALAQVSTLERFWSGIDATSRFRMNETGGIHLLVKQMMEAESFGFAVHEIVWRVLGRRELSAQFIKIPTWHFENRTGSLRFLPSASLLDGIDMRPGEWLVTTGDAIGIAAAICASLKRTALADWAIFCERCGMPFFIGRTSAPFGSEQWNNLTRALRAIGREARLQIDKNTEISTVQTSATTNQPYSPLVDWADRAISCLYRGADLATISKDNTAVGASLQDDERDILEDDACRRVSEALNKGVEPFVLSYSHPGEEIMAGIRLVSTCEKAVRKSSLGGEKSAKEGVGAK